MASRRSVGSFFLACLLCVWIGRSDQLPAEAGVRDAHNRVAREIGGDANEREWNELFAHNYKDLVGDEQDLYRDEKREEDEKEEEDWGVFSGRLNVVEQWPVQELAVGQIGGLATDNEGHLHVFHRGSRTWKDDSFGDDNVFAQKQDGPIREPTLFTVNASNGVLLNEGGENKFYLPHGLTIDSNGNKWMTDVAMHQVFKFEPGKKEPSLVVGKLFEPSTGSNDTERFCKPTDVAVASNGDFYVSDGYCASRVMKFDKTGKFLVQFGVDDFQIAHSIVLIEELDLVCVADRENMRVLCYNAGIVDASKLGDPEREYTSETMGRVFAITYSQPDGMMYGVTGPTGVLLPQGFTIDMKDDARYKTDIIATWSPEDKGFSMPHDVTVSPDGQVVFVSEIAKRNPIWKFMKDQ